MMRRTQTGSKKKFAVKSHDLIINRTATATAATATLHRSRSRACLCGTYAALRNSFAGQANSAPHKRPAVIYYIHCRHYYQNYYSEGRVAQLKQLFYGRGLTI